MSDDDSIDSQDRLARSRRRRFRLLVLMPLSLLLFLVVVAIAMMAIRNLSAAAKVAVELERLRTNSLPYDNTSLIKYHDSLTTTQDIAKWLKLLDIVSSEEFLGSTNGIYPWQEDDRPIPAAGQPWPEEAGTLAFLRKWAELRDDTRTLAAADVKRRFPIKIDAINTNLHLTSQTRQLARLFQLEAQVAMRRKSSLGTRDAILTILGCGRSVEGQPFLVSQLVSIAVEGVALGQLQAALRDDLLSTNDLRIVLARINVRTPWHTNWQVAMNGERAGILPLFSDPSRYLSETLGKEIPFHLPWRSRDTLSFLDASQQALSLPEKPLNAFYVAVQQMDQELTARFRTGNPIDQFDTIICGYVVPAYAAAGAAFVQRESLARLATLAIGVRLYEDQFDTLPANLEDLKKLGLDVDQLTPIGDQPFGYKRTDQTAVIWGFSIHTQTATPPQPPDLSEDSRWEQQWVWEFR